LSCTEGKPPHLQSWKDATGAEAYEGSFWKALQDGDFASAERRLAPIYTLTTPAGIAGRDKAMAYFRSLDLRHIEIADIRVDPEAADMVVSYQATVHTRSSSAPARYYMTTVWQQAKGGWIAICHTEVRANP
jgi:limonene-1,2-epoxide hydrolase